MKPITVDQLPTESLDMMSDDQKSYIDEFTFYRTPRGTIHAFYAGEPLAIWDGQGWCSHHIGEVFHGKRM